MSWVRDGAVALILAAGRLALAPELAEEIGTGDDRVTALGDLPEYFEDGECSG